MRNNTSIATPRLPSVTVHLVLADLNVAGAAWLICGANWKGWDSNERGRIPNY